MSTVSWVQDSESRYEVSSKEHLLQLMNQGALYTDDGTPPSDYWASDYIQTVDIDLIDDHAAIEVIGGTALFSGGYDGNFFKISNWSYTDATNAIRQVGLFGNIYGATLSKISLTGVWVLSGFEHCAGFLCGMANRAVLADIEADFSEGTLLGGSSVTAESVGGLVGWSYYGNCRRMNLRGTVELAIPTATMNVGGTVGRGRFASLAMLRNSATFVGGINGENCGGIVGLSEHSHDLSHCISTMKGDIVGSVSAGGISGYYEKLETKSSPTRLVNSMTGNIKNTGGGGAGGIVGEVLAALTAVNLTLAVNYMSGNVSSTTANKGGGMVGHITDGGTTGKDATLSNSIVAMNGAVQYSVCGSADFQPSLVICVVDTSFGMSHVYNDYGTLAVGDLTDFITDTTFSALPYVEIADDTEYTWDFVFGNLGGNPLYADSDYTHLSLHKGQVSAPFHADFGLSESNTVVYLTYGNVYGRSLFIDSSSFTTVVDFDADVVYNYAKTAVLFGIPPPMRCHPRPLNIKVVLDPFSDQAGCVNRLTYFPLDGSKEILEHDNFTEMVRQIDGRVAETTYTIRLYTDESGSGSSYTLSGEEQCTTPANSSNNYDITDFVSADGLYDISGLGEETSSVMNDLFTTGDSVEVDMDFYGKNSKVATFVNRGGTVDLATNDTILLPFDPSSGGSQNATLTLTENSSVGISFDEASGGVTIGSSQYTHGQSLILDGKKVTVVDI